MDVLVQQWILHGHVLCCSYINDKKRQTEKFWIVILCLSVAVKNMKAVVDKLRRGMEKIQILWIDI